MDSFTVACEGETYTCDVAETAPGHIILRSRGGGATYYKSVTYRESSHLRGSTWFEFGEDCTSLAAARAALVAGRMGHAMPGGKLEDLLRATIRKADRGDTSAGRFVVDVPLPGMELEP